MRNGNTEADPGAHRFFALFERSQNSITIFRFDLVTRDQQIHQLNDGVPALGRLHFRDDLISGKKLSQRHADSSGAGSLSCGLRMTRSIWLRSQVVEKRYRDRLFHSWLDRVTLCGAATQDRFTCSPPKPCAANLPSSGCVTARANVVTEVRAV